jgi:hypothetical protein
MNNDDISNKLFTTEMAHNVDKHILANTWILWYHDPDDTNWSLASYKKIYEFNTIEDFWRLYNNLPSIANSMFFLMKKGHPPIWEVPQNINGGAWLYRFPKKMADCYWTKFSMYLIGETLMTDTQDIIGISISPKIFNVTIRIWNCNSERICNKLLGNKFNPDYPELVRDQPLYKQFRPSLNDNEQQEAHKERHFKKYKSNNFNKSPKTTPDSTTATAGAATTAAAVGVGGSSGSSSSSSGGGGKPYQKNFHRNV